MDSKVVAAVLLIIIGIGLFAFGKKTAEKNRTSGIIIQIFAFLCVLAVRLVLL